MRLTIKALGWIIAFLWIITLVLPVSVAFSLLRLIEGRNMGIQEPTFAFSDGNLSILLPFYVNNTGFYDMSEISLNIQLGRANKTLLAISKNLPGIPAGRMLNASFSISRSLQEVFLNDKELLTKDMELNLNAELGFRVASALAFQIAAKFPAQWGAPFYNLTIYDAAYNDTANTFSFSISFSNHAYYPLNGHLLIELYNFRNESIVSAGWDLDVPSGEDFQKSFDVEVDPSKVTDALIIRLYFDDMKIFEEECSIL